MEQVNNLSQIPAIAQNSGILGEKAKQIVIDITQVISETEEIRNEISSKQLVIHRILAEQITVSDAFANFFEMWRDQENSISDNVISLQQLTKLNEEVHLLHQFMEEYESKLKSCFGNLNNSMKSIHKHNTNIQESLTALGKAMTLSELDAIVIPDLAWAQLHTGADVETLDNEWEEMKLGQRVIHCLNKLEQLVETHSGNSDSMDDSF